MNLSDSKKYPIRNTVRIVLLNDKNQLLLMRVDDPGTHSIGDKYSGSFWVTIGGQQEPGETVTGSALRELTEETGIKKDDVKFGPVVWLRELDLVIYTKPVQIKEQYILAHTIKYEVTPTNLTDYEINIVKELRWFSLDDISNSKETIYPPNLKTLLKDVISNIIPQKPIVIR